MVQGPQAIIAYTPLTNNEKNNGFIASLFTIDSLVASSQPPNYEQHYHVWLMYDDQLYGDVSNEKLSVQQPLMLGDLSLTLVVAPTHAFIEQTSSLLSNYVLMVGSALVVLMGVVIYFVLMSRLQASAIFANEHFFSQVFSSLKSGVFVVDKQGMIKTANTSALQVLEATADCVQGTCIDLWLVAIKSDREYLLSALDIPSMLGAYHTIIAKRQSGERCPIELSVSEIKLEGDTFFSLSFQDISYRLSVERDLVAARTEMEELSYRTSNDIRAPIASSIRLIDLAMSEQEDKIVADKSLLLAKSSLTKVELLIHSILSLMQVKNNQEAPTVVELNLMIDDVLRSQSPKSFSDNIQIKQSLLFDGELVVRPSLLKLIIQHLLSNAIQYQDTRKFESFVKISIFEKDRRFVLEVIDNGLGIAEDQQHKLFTMFTRFHAKIAEGSGLGLYLSLKCAELIGGELHHVNRDGNTVFCLTIPLDK